MSLTLTFIVPAYNEEEHLPATLESLLAQTDPAEQIIVVDDCSTDRTREIAESYGVKVLTPSVKCGSKARAQNHALPYCTSDLVLPVDADTVLAADYAEHVKKPFESDPAVVVAAGCVLTRFERTPSERGRSIEYLFGFHLQRPIQNLTRSVAVCSGCCAAFRRAELVEFGGFPERTIVEDMDYTWSQQILGRRAVYVGDALAWAADPETITYLRSQVWRWMSGFFQNVRLHLRGLLRRKKMLALWVLVAIWEILTVPLWYAAPVVLTVFFDWDVGRTLAWWFGGEMIVLVPPLIYAARRRKLSLFGILCNLPFVYLAKAVNFVYAWKAMIVELVLVPLGRSSGLRVYVKGRPDLPTKYTKKS